LFAPDLQSAEVLFRGLASTVQTNSLIVLDVPEINSAAMTLAARYGMERVFETARMYTQPSPQILIERVFGVTTFELG
jgi:hypothetical protein